MLYCSAAARIWKKHKPQIYIFGKVFMGLKCDWTPHVCKSDANALCIQRTGIWILICAEIQVGLHEKRSLEQSR
jgi:hypothetical protein